jgi:hypothetical protein
VLGEAKAFYQQVHEDGHQHLHIMLNRIRPYVQEGRYQNESQAHSVDDGVADMLRKLDVPLISADPSEESLKSTLDYCRSLRKLRLELGKVFGT